MMLAEGTTLESGLILFLAVLALTFFSLLMTRRARQRMARSQEDAREQFAHLREQTGLRDTMDDLLVQLEEVSRRTNAQFDTKCAKLEAVVRDADDRIGRLKELLAQIEQAPGPAGGMAALAPPCGAPAGGMAALAPPCGAPPNDHAGPRAGMPPGDAPGRSPTPPKEPPIQRIYELADDGAAPIKIAQMTGMPLGEVEVILNLRRLE